MTREPGEQTRKEMQLCRGWGGIRTGGQRLREQGGSRKKWSSRKSGSRKLVWGWQGGAKEVYNYLEHNTESLKAQCE
jgi:hypothetical protein